MPSSTSNDQDQVQASPASKAFAARLARYAYVPPAPPPRRGPRRAGPLVDGSGADERAASTSSAMSILSRPSQTALGRQGGKRRLASNEVFSDTDRTDGERERSWSWDSEAVPPASPSKTPPKRPRADPVPRKRSDGSPSGFDPRPLSRAAASTATTTSTKTKAKVKKVPRPFAPPETYAHLKNTPDHLAPDLKIVFCGINPGKMSAATGTHFAHPTNKFWRALHQSGLTPRLYAPTECSLLPSELGYGLTNLCGRPTAEQAELSTLEMRLNVHPFVLKIAHHRPRVVCFVGKKIWDVFAGVCGKTARRVESGDESDRLVEGPAASERAAGEGSADPADHGATAVASIKPDRVPLRVESTAQTPRPSDPSSPSASVSSDAELRRSTRVKTEPGLEVDAIDVLSAAERAELDRQDQPLANEATVKRERDEQSSSSSSLSPSPSPLRQYRSASTDASGPNSSLPSPRMRQYPRTSKQANARQTKGPTGEMDWYAPRPLRLPLPPRPPPSSARAQQQTEYTYFWVTKSTSGLERTAMSEQVAIFSALKRFSDSLSAGSVPDSWVDADEILDIDIAGLARTSEAMRTAAIQQGKTVLPSAHALVYD